MANHDCARRKIRELGAARQSTVKWRLYYEQTEPRQATTAGTELKEKTKEFEQEETEIAEKE